MKSTLQIIPTGDMSLEDWLAYRTSGIGASEAGAILGLSPYQSSIGLFYEKIGEPRRSVENMAMFMGKAMEPLIASMWEAWEGTEESMLKNVAAGRKVRKCSRVNAYVRNPKYPWLFVSLDRRIHKHADKDEGSLELKTIGGWEADKWESEVPPVHIIQVQTQLMVCEFGYGELATLKDGRHFDVLPFEHMPDVCETIATRTKDFWDKVVEGRRLKGLLFEAQQEMNQRKADEFTEAIQALEPPPDGSEAYTKFLKEKYQIAIPGELAGSLAELETAHKEKEVAGRIKELEEERRHLQNILKVALREFDVLDFGQNGKISWKANVKGHRVFLNKTKD